MALDIRLDFMNKIKPEYLEMMTALRQKFIDIDEGLKLLADSAVEQNLPAAGRTVALARTANEQACQSAIKSLCILGEDK